MRCLALTLTLLVACGSDDEECIVDTSYAPAIDPTAFVDEVTNPLFPLPDGASWVYEGGGETIEVTVIGERRTILGISATVVHDVASIDGEVVEDTLDFYAQDEDGNVWYLGEETAELEGGIVVSTLGSWEAGVDGAQPGILIPAVPEIGVPYRQEYLACEAEDFGEVIALDQTVAVGGNTHTGCLQTEDTTPLEPDLQEHKFYCPNVGLVLIVDVVTGGREELVEMTAP